MRKIILISVLAAAAVVFSIILLSGEKGEKVQPTPTSILNPTPTATSISENSNFMETKNGVTIEILKEGQGQEAKNGDAVLVHYVGTLENGVKFDSSLDRETPFSFTLGADRVIQGWDIGVSGMKIGEKRKLTITSDKAYGSNGVPGVIPPNAILIFEVELLKIN